MSGRCFLRNHKQKKIVQSFRHITPNLVKRKHESSPRWITFFVTRVKFLGHNFEGTTITFSKFRILAFLKFQSTSKNKNIKKFLGMLNFSENLFWKCNCISDHSTTLLHNKIILNGYWNIKNASMKLKPSNVTNSKYNCRLRPTILRYVRCFQFWNLLFNFTISSRH